MSSFEQALELHQRHCVLVSHMDLPAELQLRRSAGQNGTLTSRYKARCRAAGIRVIIGAIFVHPSYLPNMALSMAMEQIAALLAEIQESNGAFCLARNAAELDAALLGDQVAIVLSLEGSEPLGGTSSLLHVFYALGVRLLGLTWNGRTMAADGCRLQGGGLTPLGRQLVCDAQELGMAMDVSHLNDAGFSDLLELTDNPVIASHSNCRALCDHPRNLTDSQIMQLAQRGGVIGVNQVRFLTRQPNSTDNLQDLRDHILRIIQLTGPGHVGLGLDLARDYMEALPKPRAYWRTWDPQAEDILHDYTDLVHLTALLLEQGIDEETLSGILGGNFLRVLRNILK